MKIITPYQINDASLIGTNVPESDYSLWDSITSYAIGTTLMYIEPNKHWVIRSLVDGNVGNVPTGLASDTKWVKVSETNRWKMFDLKATSQTVGDYPVSGATETAMFDADFFDEAFFDTEVISGSQGIEVTVGLPQMVNALYVGNVIAANLSVVGRNQLGSVIYNHSQSMVSVAGIVDPWTYFFNPIVFKRELVLDDLPPYGMTTYSVALTSVAPVSVGTLAFGYIFEPGLSRYGMTMSIQDYSIKLANEFGDQVLTQRAYSKRLAVDAFVPKGNTDYMIDFLNTYRATPLVWIGSGQYEGSILYGFYKDYQAVVSYPTETLFNWDIEGLS